MADITKKEAYLDKCLTDVLSWREDVFPSIAEKHFMEEGEESLKSGDLLKAKSDFEIVCRINPENKEAGIRAKEIEEIIRSTGMPKSLEESKDMLLRYYMSNGDNLLGEENFEAVLERHDKGSIIRENTSKAKFDVAFFDEMYSKAMEKIYDEINFMVIEESGKVPVIDNGPEGIAPSYFKAVPYKFFREELKTTQVTIHVSDTEAESAIRKLQKSGIDMKRLSILGKAKGFHDSGDRMKFLNKLAPSSGGLRGLLFGSACFFIPDIGQIVALGPVAGMIAMELKNSTIVGSITAFRMGLYRIGIPKKFLAKIETLVKVKDWIIVIVHGVELDKTKEQNIINSTHSQESETHYLNTQDPK